MAKKLCSLSSLLILFFLFFVFTDKTFAQVKTCTTWKSTVSSLPSCTSPLFLENCNRSGSFTGTECCTSSAVAGGPYQYCEQAVLGQTPQYSFRCCSDTVCSPGSPTEFRCLNTCAKPDGTSCPAGEGAMEISSCRSDGSGYNTTYSCSVNCTGCPPPAPPPPPPNEPTCSSDRCDLCTDCSSCISQAACGWNGSVGACQAGSASGPNGAQCNQWQWTHCSPPSECPGPTPPPPPPPPPTGPEAPILTSFTPDNQCFSNDFSATLEWEGSPIVSGSCAGGFWVDISTDENFGTYSHKCVTGNNTSSPDGFGFSYAKGGVYHARVYNGQHSPERQLVVPNNLCSATCNLVKDSCQPVSGGTSCNFSSTYTLNGTNQVSYQRNLIPDSGGSTLQTGFRASSQPLSWVYQPGTYVAKMEAKENDGTDLTTCPVNVVIDQNPPSCNVDVDPIKRSATGAYNNTSINYSTISMDSGAIWFSPQSCSGSSCPATGWGKISDYSVTGDGPHESSWDPNGFCPTDGGPGTVAVTKLQNGGQTIKCTVPVTCPSTTTQSCTIVASPNPVESTKETFISVDSNSLPTNMPSSKMSQWDFDNNGTIDLENSTLSERYTYTTGTTPKNITATFKVVSQACKNNPAGCNVLSQCSTSITVYPKGGTAPPPSGGIPGVTDCNGPNESCYDINVGLQGCQASSPGETSQISSIKDLWCQTTNSSTVYACRYCPTSIPPPSSQTCPEQPRTPPNDRPTAIPQPDGHTLLIEYRYNVEDSNNEGSIPHQFNPLGLLFTPAFAQVSSRDIRGTIVRSTSAGFIETTGTEKITQFGTSSPAFDKDPHNSSSYRLFYYQGQASNGATSKPTNTVAVVLDKDRSRSCNIGEGYGRPLLSGARLISSTTTSLTFEITYKVGPPNAFADCSTGPCSVRNAPPYLQIQGSSTPGFVSWGAGAHSVVQRCSRGGGNDCLESIWRGVYTISLPPGTFSTYSVSGYHDGACPPIASIGSASFSGGTVTSTPAPLQIPTLSAIGGSDGRGDPYAQVSFTPLVSGQQIKIYGVDGTDSNQIRWTGSNISTSRTFENGAWVFRATDDLESLPSGTYYYGVDLDLLGITGTSCSRDRYTKTDQTGYAWTGVSTPWFKTRDGDVHSNIRINTRGGPR